MQTLSQIAAILVVSAILATVVSVASAACFAVALRAWRRRQAARAKAGSGTSSSSQSGWCTRHRTFVLRLRVKGGDEHWRRLEINTKQVRTLAQLEAAVLRKLRADADAATRQGRSGADAFASGAKITKMIVLPAPSAAAGAVGGAAGVGASAAGTSQTASGGSGAAAGEVGGFLVQDDDDVRALRGGEGLIVELKE